MNLKELYTTIKYRAGRKTEAKEKPKKSYHIYDRCEICPLSVYVDVIENGNLKALIIKGRVPQEELVLARTMLTIEFSELSGSSHLQSTINVIRQMYLRRSQIEGLRMAAILINGGLNDQAMEYLKPYHIKLNNPLDPVEIERVIKQIEGKIKGKIVSLQELQKRYDALTVKTDTEKPKSGYYTEMLTVLSKYVGFHLSKDKLNVAEFALYLKQFNQEMERLSNK